MRRWLEHLAALKTSAETRRKYRAAVVGLGEKALRSWTAAELDAHFSAAAGRGLSSSSLALLVAGLRSFFRWAAAVGEVASDPSLVLRCPRRRQAEPDYLTKGEVHKLLYGAYPGFLEPSPRAARNRLLWPLCYWAGLRIGEVCRLKVDDVELLESGLFAVSIRDAKWGSVGRREVADKTTSAMLVYYIENQRARLKPAGDWLFPAGRADSRGKPAALGVRQARRVFDAAWRAAGIHRRGREIHPHILRHSLATHLIQEGRSVPDIQTWMRHRSAQTTLRYVHSRDVANLRRALFRADHLQPKQGRLPLLDALARELK